MYFKLKIGLMGNHSDLFERVRLKLICSLCVKASDANVKFSDLKLVVLQCLQASKGCFATIFPPVSAMVK